jgi:solute carrier family 25 (mitochondrial carnitine/acylcarnitine transporter), member 20/29
VLQLNCPNPFTSETDYHRVKCRAQLLPRQHTPSSLHIMKDIYRANGIRGLYFGGLITSLRDSIGYGFYFWGYEGAKYILLHPADSERMKMGKMLSAGGIAGCITWASIYPLGTPTPHTD